MFIETKDEKKDIMEQTPISDITLAEKIAEVARSKFGENLSPNQIALILAQNSHETGYRKHMYNNNIGNIKYTGPQDKYNYFSADTDEHSGKNWYRINAKFRSYKTIEDGIEDYLRLLKNRNGGSVWRAIKSEDPEIFSHELKQIGYYTAPEEEYTRALKRIYNKDKAKLQSIKLDSLKQKLNKIFDLVQTMQLSITAYDLNENRLLNKMAKIKGKNGK